MNRPDIRRGGGKSNIVHACGHEEKHSWPDPDFLRGDHGDTPMRVLREIWEETLADRPCSQCREQPRYVRKE